MYLRCSLVENISSLDDVGHHSVFQLLVLLSSQLDGLQLRPTTPTHTPKHTYIRCIHTLYIYDIEHTDLTVQKDE